MSERWHYIDKQGVRQWPDDWEDARPFSGGLARVEDRGKYGYIDRQGKLVIRTVYAEAGDFQGSYAPVRIRQEPQWALIDKQGIVRFRDLGVCPPQYGGEDRWLLFPDQDRMLLISFPDKTVLFESDELRVMRFVTRSTEPFDGVWLLRYTDGERLEYRDLHGRLLLRDRDEPLEDE